MNNIRLISALFSKIIENQNALCAAVEELTLWVEESGSTIVASNIRGALVMLRENDTIIAEGIERMMAVQLIGSGGADLALDRPRLNRPIKSGNSKKASGL